MPTYQPRAVFSLALALLVALVFLPPELRWPLHYLTTFVHESGHALAALVTGGTVTGFVVQPTGGGFAQVDGGYRPLVLSGGYLGTAAAGCLLLLANASRRLRGRLLFAVGVAFLALGIGLGNNAFTVAYAVTVGSLAMGVGLAAWPEVQYHLVTLLGVVVGLDAFSDALELVPVALGLSTWRAPEGIGHNLSDAGQMALLTGFPEVLWALVWSLIAAAMLAGAARSMARRS